MNKIDCQEKTNFNFMKENHRERKALVQDIGKKSKRIAEEIAKQKCKADPVFQTEKEVHQN